MINKEFDMQFHPRMGTVFLTCSLCLCAGIVPAAEKKGSSKSDPAQAAIDKTLRAEVVGLVDRRMQLAGILQAHPESVLAHWHAGFIRDGKSWRSFETPAGADANSATLADYHLQRGNAATTVEGQLQLANWCKMRGLADRERAHLFAALELDAGQAHPELLNRLGYCQVGGVWLGPDEIREWQRANQRTAASLKRWEAKLTQIVNGLAGSVRQRDHALAELDKIADPLAIPAVELMLSGQSADAAEAAISLFRRIKDVDSSQALAKQALFSQWPEVRKSAAEALKSKPVDDFGPALISLLATPVSISEVRVTSNFKDFRFSGPIVLLFSYALARETKDQFQVATFNTANYRINDYVNGISVRGRDYRASRGNNALDFRLALAQQDVLRSAADDKYALDKQVDEYNEQTEMLNGRIGSVLATVSGQPASSDPNRWWNWWSNVSDTQQSGKKPVFTVSREYVAGNPYSSGIRIRSCFAAGTPVWTERGPVAIETIQVGDLVLAQDVETGELAYRPVIQPTVRPPKELTTVQVGDEIIVCTGGHRFWVSGEGWVKARDLTAKMLLHSVTGNRPVETVEKGETEQTYNLVVADFHTYFVGQAGLLCQDLLLPAGTHNVVPGLPRASATAPAAK
jgi:hypothetical protein